MSLVGAWNIKACEKQGAVRHTVRVRVWGYDRDHGILLQFPHSNADRNALQQQLRCVATCGDKRFNYSFVVHLFNAAGQHFGFSLVRGYFVLEGKDTLKGEGEVFVYLEIDLQRPTSVIRLGAETSVGVRIIAPGQ